MLPALDEALTRLEQIDPEQARIIELRYFVGLSVEESADVMKISPATLKRRFAHGSRLAVAGTERGDAMTPDQWRRVRELFEAGARPAASGARPGSNVKTQTRRSWPKCCRCCLTTQPPGPFSTSDRRAGRRSAC